jgi:hypothetical protein
MGAPAADEAFAAALAGVAGHGCEVGSSLPSICARWCPARASR